MNFYQMSTNTYKEQQTLPVSQERMKLSKFIVLLCSNLTDQAKVDEFFAANNIIKWQYLPDNGDWYARIAIEYEVKGLDD